MEWGGLNFELHLVEIQKKSTDAPKFPQA